MKSLLIFYFVCITCQLFPQSPISDLRGFEDKYGDTHLYYGEILDEGSGQTSVNIHHLDITKDTDSIFLYGDYGPDPERHYSSSIITSYDFWNNDPSKYLVSRFDECCNLQKDSYFMRFDSKGAGWNGNVILKSWIPIYNISISKQNDSLVFVNNSGVEVSLDGGINWDTISVYTYQFISLSPFNDSTIFVSNYNNENFSNLCKSTDRGKTFSIVDTISAFIKNDHYFFYDIDSLHIYVVSYDYYTNLSYSMLSVSNSRGDTASWNVKYVNKNNKIYATIDNSKSGTIYLADGKNILVSKDYSDSFNPYKTMDSVVGGLYKKPNSDLLYIATGNDIYESTSTSIKSIKHIVTSLEKGNVGTNYKLFQNYPNPFNPSTNISYHLSEAGNVTLKIYDILGNEITTIVNGYKSAGEHTVSFDASKLASGIYFYQLKSNGFVSTKKMMLLK
jgi:hypothetical protein